MAATVHKLIRRLFRERWNVALALAELSEEVEKLLQHLGVTVIRRVMRFDLGVVTPAEAKIGLRTLVGKKRWTGELIEPRCYWNMGAANAELIDEPTFCCQLSVDCLAWRAKPPKVLSLFLSLLSCNWCQSCKCKDFLTFSNLNLTLETDIFHWRLLERGHGLWLMTNNSRDHNLRKLPI